MLFITPKVPTDALALNKLLEKCRCINDISVDRCDDGQLVIRTLEGGRRRSRALKLAINVEATSNTSENKG